MRVGHVYGGVRHKLSAKVLVPENLCLILFYTRTVQGSNVQFCSIPCRKGGPALRITPTKIYWKQETRNRAVFSEFLILDLFGLTRGAMYHGCRRTAVKTSACTMAQTAICPMRGVKTFRDTRLAVGRFLVRKGKGPAQLTAEGGSQNDEEWYFFVNDAPTKYSNR